MNDERWLPVAGYEGLYEVSDVGRVRSLGRLRPHSSGKAMERRPPCVLTAHTAGRGYLMVGLWKDGERKLRYVHRLVASAFLPASSSPHVNHIDFDKKNNAATNLEWVTPSENQQHSIAAERFRRMPNSPALSSFT